MTDSEKIYGTTVDENGNLHGTFKSMLWVCADSAFTTTKRDNGVSHNFGWWVKDEKYVNEAGQTVYVYNNRQTGKQLVVTDDLH